MFRLCVCCFSYNLPVYHYYLVIKPHPTNISYVLLKPRGPFHVSPGKFSRPKSHFKNHEALNVQSFLFQHLLHLCNVSNSRFLFQPRTLKVGYSGPKAFRGFRETDPIESIDASTSSNLHTAVPPYTGTLAP